MICSTNVSGAPTRPAAERCFREYLIAVLAGHSELQDRAFNSLLKIAAKASNKLKDFKRFENIFDGGAGYDIAVDQFINMTKGELNPKYFAHVSKLRFIDYLRKRGALKRQERHEMSDADVAAMEFKNMMEPDEWRRSMRAGQGTQAAK